MSELLAISEQELKEILLTEQVNSGGFTLVNTLTNKQLRLIAIELAQSLSKSLNIEFPVKIIKGETDPSKLIELESVDIEVNDKNSDIQSPLVLLIENFDHLPSDQQRSWIAWGARENTVTLRTKPHTNTILIAGLKKSDRSELNPSIIGKVSSYELKDSTSSTHSNFYEKLAEHELIYTLMYNAWFKFEKVLEVYKPEVDGAGVDIVLECNGIIRHIQLKISREEGKTVKQKIHIDLMKKPSGCVIWMVLNNQTQKPLIKEFLFFGSPAGQQLQDISYFPIAKHSKANKDGIKNERPLIREVNKKEFEKIVPSEILLKKLFNL